MDIDFLNNLNEISRHKLILLRCDGQSVIKTINDIQDNGIAVINVGRELSAHLKGFETAKFLTIEAQSYLQRLIQTKTASSDKPKAVALYNIGILFEPYLSLNVPKLLKELSKDCIIIILWDKFYSDGLFHWGVNAEQYHLDLSDIYIAEEGAKYEV